MSTASHTQSIERPLSGKIGGLAVWLLLSFIVASFGALFQTGEWYLTIAKPSWTPPGWIFGPVWTLLYIAMAVAAWLVWLEGGWKANRSALSLYVVQLVFNAAWSWLFFGVHTIGGALIDIVILWLLILATLILFRRRRPAAGLLLVPYALWVGFATALNFQIWRLN